MSESEFKILGHPKNLLLIGASVLRAGRGAQVCSFCGIKSIVNNKGAKKAVKGYVKFHCSRKDKLIQLICARATCVAKVIKRLFKEIDLTAYVVNSPVITMTRKFKDKLDAIKLTHICIVLEKSFRELRRAPPWVVWKRFNYWCRCNSIYSSAFNEANDEIYQYTSRALFEEEIEI